MSDIIFCDFGRFNNKLNEEIIKADKENFAKNKFWLFNVLHLAKVAEELKASDDEMNIRIKEIIKIQKIKNPWIIEIGFKDFFVYNGNII